jgi:hypothetical protein
MTLEEVTAVLDKYTGQHGLNIRGNNLSEKYMNLTTNDMQHMGPEELGEAAYVLSNYALYLQKEVNHQQAIVVWCKDNLDYILADKADQYGGQFCPHAERKLLAIKDSEIARELYKVQMHAKMRVETLSFMPSRIEALSKKLEELQQTKRRQKYVAN